MGGSSHRWQEKKENQEPSHMLRQECPNPFGTTVILNSPERHKTQLEQMKRWTTYLRSKSELCEEARLSKVTL